MPKVLNKYRDKISEGAIYIGRPSKWGNPFVIGKDGSRAKVIAMYKFYIESMPKLLESVRVELRGKDLVCFCAPLACHGDILLEIANKEDKQ